MKSNKILTKKCMHPKKSRSLQGRCKIGKNKKLETKQSSNQNYSEKQYFQAKTKPCVNIHYYICK